MITLKPGATIGILGGGQLGRMTALAAANLGYKAHIFCVSKDEPALQVASFFTLGAYDDKAALQKFAQEVDVVTLEWENIPLGAIEAVSALTPVHPGIDSFRIAQDRRLEKEFARKCGIGTAPTCAVESLDELKRALETIKTPAILKTARMGYDGKGQILITAALSSQDAWMEVGGQPSVLEGFVDFECEVSVIVARREDGAIAAYPAVRNVHKNHVLAETTAPAGLDPEVEKEAEAIATRLAQELKLIGLLAVEMFVLKKPDAEGHRVLMNEIAPRPHNSGHWTMNACACSQFEQLVRAVCGLPLGSTTPHSKAVMRNLLGDEVENWPTILADKKACLNLYGKAEARAGRKMGHVTYLGEAW